MSDAGNSRRVEWTPELIARVSASVAVVLAGAIILGVFAAAANAWYVFAVAAGAVLTVVVAWQFEAALVVYTMVAFVPWGGTPDLAVGGSGVGKGVYISELMLGFLLVVWVGKYLLGALPRERIGSGFYLPMALYIAYCTINVINAYVFWDPHVSRAYQYPMVNAIEIGLRVLSAGALIMMATTVTNRKWLTWITFALFVPGVYCALNALAGGVIPIGAAWSPLLALLPAGYCWALLLDPAQSKSKKVFALILLALLILQIFVRNITWISGWLGVFTAIGVVTLIRSKKMFFAWIAVMCAVVVLAQPFLQKNIVEHSKAEGDYDRFALMAGALKYATTFPVGVGLGNYRTYNSFYYGEKWNTTSYTSAHGTYSQSLSETGFAGLALFLLMLASGFTWMLRSYREMRSGRSKLFMLAAMGQLIGIACASIIGDYIIPTYHNGGIQQFSVTVYSWLIWGLAVAHVRIDRADPAVDTPFDKVEEPQFA